MYVCIISLSKFVASELSATSPHKEACGRPACGAPASRRPSWRLDHTTQHTVPVSVNKNTPPENNTHWNISFQSTKSGAGKQFLPLDFRTVALRKGVFFFTDTGITRQPASHHNRAARATSQRTMAVPVHAIYIYIYMHIYIYIYM